MAEKYLKIDFEACKKEGISPVEALYIFLIENCDDLKKLHESCVDKGFITARFDGSGKKIGYRSTNKMTSKVANAVADSNTTKEENDRYKTLATALKEIYPKGKKPGTSWYWADGIALIAKRLKIFFHKYPEYKSYTDEQIVNATNAYINSFNGDYSYMKLLKYFIFKEQIKAGEVESTSDLITYLENADQIDSISDDWTDDLK